MSGSKLALGTIGALAAAALIARRGGSPARRAKRGPARKARGSRGRRYEVSEWVDFFAGGNASEQTKDLGRRFDEIVWPIFEAWFDTPMGRESGFEADDFDHNDVAYRTYASMVGHGIGLWDGQLFYERGAPAGKAPKLGQSLDEWMQTHYAISSLLNDASGNDDLIQDLENAINEDDPDMDYGEE